MSKKMNEKMASSIVGTKKYFPPEILRNKKYYTEVDIWSYGVVLYQCLLGVTVKLLPQMDTKISQNQNHIKEIFKNKGKEFEKLVEVCYQCCQKDPVKRPTAKEILDYLKGDLKNFSISESKITIENNSLTNWKITNEIGKEFWSRNFKVTKLF
jgi:serine/threonine protein kinase